MSCWGLAATCPNQSQRRARVAPADGSLRTNRPRPTVTNYPCTLTSVTAVWSTLRSKIGSSITGTESPLRGLQLSRSRSAPGPRAGSIRWPIPTLGQRPRCALVVRRRPLLGRRRITHEAAPWRPQRQRGDRPVGPGREKRTRYGTDANWASEGGRTPVGGPSPSEIPRRQALRRRDGARARRRQRGHVDLADLGRPKLPLLGLDLPRSGPGRT